MQYAARFFFFFVLVFFSSNAQIRKMCTYESYLPVSEYIDQCGFQKPQRLLGLEKKVDSLFNLIGEQRNFQIKSCAQIRGISAMNFDSFHSPLERFVVIQENTLDLDSLIANHDWNILGRFLHAMGHHMRQHLLIDSIDFFEEEVEADEAVGFMLSKMGVSKENSLKTIDFVPDSTVNETHAPTIKRKNAVIRGWNWGQDGTSTLPKKDYVELLPVSETQELDYMQQHNTAHKEGKYELASWHALKAFQYSGGKNRKMLAEAAYHFHQNGQFAMSLKCYLTLLDRGIGFLARNGKLNVFVIVGINYYFLEEWDMAIQYLTAAHLMLPKDLQTLNYLAATYQKKRDWEMCGNYVKKMIKLDSKNPDHTFNLGITYERQQEVHKAISLYRRAIYITPTHTKSRVALATLYVNEANGLILLLRSKGYYQGMGQKKYKKTRATVNDLLAKAEQVLTKGLDLNPDDIRILETLLMIYKQTGKKEKQEQVEKRLEVLGQQSE